MLTIRPEQFLGLLSSFGPPALYLDRGQTCQDQEHTFEINEKTKATLKLTKEETPDLTYKLTVFFHRILGGQGPHWSIAINDRTNEDLEFAGSTSFIVKPVDKNTLEIKETDTTNTGITRRVQLLGSSLVVT